MNYLEAIVFYVIGTKDQSCFIIKNSTGELVPDGIGNQFGRCDVAMFSNIFDAQQQLDILNGNSQQGDQFGIIWTIYPIKLNFNKDE